MHITTIAISFVLFFINNGLPTTPSYIEKSADFAHPEGQPSFLMYAPWRQSYASRQEHNRPFIFDTSKLQEASACVFCKQHTEQNDAKYLILKRFSTCYVMMNAYPFSVGHIMVLPFAHKAFLHELTAEELDEISRVITLATVIVGQTIKPEGLNVGLNLGSAAGASVPAHLHAQIVPRWTSDAAFMSVIGQTRVITTEITLVYNDLKKAFDALP